MTAGSAVTAEPAPRSEPGPTRTVNIRHDRRPQHACDAALNRGRSCRQRLRYGPACLFPPVPAGRISVADRGMVLNEAGCCRSPRPCHSAREVLTAGAVSSQSWLKAPAVAAARGAPAHPDDRHGRRAQMAQGTVKRFNSDNGYGSSPPATGRKTFPFTTPPPRLTATASPGLPARHGDGS